MSYQTLNSRKQIQAIINSNIRKVFLKFIERRLGIDSIQFYDIYNSSNKDDFEIYKKIKQLIKLRFSDKDKAFNSRAAIRSEDVSKILKQLNVNGLSKYLDVGSDDCRIPIAIADKLSIVEAYGSDITDNCEDEEEIEFIKLVPFEHSSLYTKENINTFDLMTAFQSLHHIEDIDFRLEELSELCKEGCTFIVREHDAINNEIKMLIDIEHLIYEVLIDGVDIKEFTKNYYARYFSIIELEDLLRKYEFEKVYQGEIFGFTRYYYSAYRKI